MNILYNKNPYKPSKLVPLMVKIVDRLPGKKEEQAKIQRLKKVTSQIYSSSSHEFYHPPKGSWFSISFKNADMYVFPLQNLIRVESRRYLPKVERKRLITEAEELAKGYEQLERTEFTILRDF
jgi:hypothetical protein